MAERKRVSDDEAAGLAAKGAPSGVDMPGDGSGPQPLASPGPGEPLAPVKESPPSEPAEGPSQRVVLKDGGLVVDTAAPAASGIGEAVPGGRYRVGGVLVDADGKPIAGTDKE